MALVPSSPKMIQACNFRGSDSNMVAGCCLGSVHYVFHVFRSLVMTPVSVQIQEWRALCCFASASPWTHCFSFWKHPISSVHYIKSRANQFLGIRIFLALKNSSPSKIVQHSSAAPKDEGENNYVNNRWPLQPKLQRRSLERQHKWIIAKMMPSKGVLSKGTVEQKSLLRFNSCLEILYIESTSNNFILLENCKVNIKMWEGKFFELGNPNTKIPRGGDGLLYARSVPPTFPNGECLILHLKLTHIALFGRQAWNVRRRNSWKSCQNVLSCYTKTMAKVNPLEVCHD